MPSISELLRLVRPKERLPERELSPTELLIQEIISTAEGQEFKSAVRIASIVRSEISLCPQRFDNTFLVHSKSFAGNSIDVDYDPRTKEHKEVVVTSMQFPLRPMEAFDLSTPQNHVQFNTRLLPFAEGWLGYGLETYQVAHGIVTAQSQK